MNSFVNPLSRKRPIGFSERVAEIKNWTRIALSLDEQVIVSVNELACSQPGCPPRQTVVLVFSDAPSAVKLAVHKSLLDIIEADIVEAAQSRDAITMS
ncbi:hypothetical protein [Brucella intermedia]|uniref:hypothetical protein n=1 Tax=Brucella intermedia TaxID=94625 RepID=UPI0022498298|nr:hypothetical protein [Brucella intermedia]